MVPRWKCKLVLKNRKLNIVREMFFSVPSVSLSKDGTSMMSSAASIAPAGHPPPPQRVGHVIHVVHVARHTGPGGMQIKTCNTRLCRDGLRDCQ